MVKLKIDTDITDIPASKQRVLATHKLYPPLEKVTFPTADRNPSPTQYPHATPTPFKAFLFDRMIVVFK